MQLLEFLVDMKGMEMTTIIRLFITAMLVIPFTHNMSGQTVELHYRINRKHIPLSFPDTSFRTWAIKKYEYDLSNNIDTILFENDTLNIVLSPFVLERKDEKKGITCIDYATFTYSQRKFVQSLDIPYIVPFIKIKYTIGLSNYVFLFRHSKDLRYKLTTYSAPSMRIYK